MHVKEIREFSVDGKRFKNTDEVRKYVENKIGLIIDELHPRLPPKQALKMLELLIINRDDLIDLLGSTMDLDSEPLQDISVFEE